MKAFLLHSDRLYRLQRLGYHLHVAAGAWRKGVPLSDYARFALPPVLRPVAELPHSIYLEFSNVCNITCTYCSCPLAGFSEPFLRADVLDALVRQLAQTPVNKLHIGGGEPTMHPQFGGCVRELSRCARFMNIVTNGQWTRDDVFETLASGVFDLIEISVDAGGREAYERSRMGARFDLLVDNIHRLRQALRAHGAETILGIRVMIRPSTSVEERRHLREWGHLCDVIFPLYVSQPARLPEVPDVFRSVHVVDRSIPRCTHPGRALQIKADGSVPLCCVNGHAAGPERIVLGDIREHSLAELWRHPTLVQYRSAHRSRHDHLMPLCHGCPGA